MCEVLGGSQDLDGADAAFTVGLFSVADALLDAPMDDVLETLPFSEEIRDALLRREGPKGELLERGGRVRARRVPRGRRQPAGRLRRSRGVGGRRRLRRRRLTQLRAARINRTHALTT